MVRFGFVSISVVVAIAACTDNGSSVHGETFGPFPERDAGVQPQPGVDGGGNDSGSDAGGCAAGAVAVLAGGSASFTASIQDRNGAWSSGALGTSTIKSKPALVAFGTGFLGVAHDGNDALVSVRYTDAWSAPASFGTAGVKGPPSLAVSGTNAHVVYSAGAAADRLYWSGVYDGNSWNAGTTRVSSDGTQAQQSFGTISAGLAPVGNEVAFVENGSDNKVYVRTSSGAAWSTSKEVVGAAGGGSNDLATPELVALDGALDLAAIYVDGPTRQISYATRASASNPAGDWVDGNSVNVLARTDERLSVARVAPQTLVVAFRGQDGNGYYTSGTIAGASITWVAAQAIGGGANVAVSSAPAVARGVCGDDAIVVYAEGSTIKATRLRGTTWTAPETIAGASGTFVAVATKN